MWNYWYLKNGVFQFFRWTEWIKLRAAQNLFILIINHFSRTLNKCQINFWLFTETLTLLLPVLHCSLYFSKTMKVDRHCNYFFFNLLTFRLVALLASRKSIFSIFSMVSIFLLLLFDSFSNKIRRKIETIENLLLL